MKKLSLLLFGLLGLFALGLFFLNPFLGALVFIAGVLLYMKK